MWIFVLMYNLRNIILLSPGDCFTGFAEDL